MPAALHALERLGHERGVHALAGGHLLHDQPERHDAVGHRRARRCGAGRSPAGSARPRGSCTRPGCPSSPACGWSACAACRRRRWWSGRRTRPRRAAPAAARLPAGRSRRTPCRGRRRTCSRARAPRRRLRRSTWRGSPSNGRAVEVGDVAEHPGLGATFGSPHGSTSNVFGSGMARTSLSWMRLKPSIDEPSKVIPSSSAFSSSAGLMAKLFRLPSTSVNHSRIRRTPRSSTVRNT